MRPPQSAENDWLEGFEGHEWDALIKWSQDWIERHAKTKLNPLFLTDAQFEAMSAWFDRNVNKYGEAEPLPAILADIGPPIAPED